MSEATARVLIVDDDAILRRLLAKTFLDVGYTVDEAGDGAAAIRMFRESRPDVVLMDIIMPGREGVETIVELRAMDRTAPIVAMSGGGRVGPNEFLSLAVALGATTSIRKPFTVGQIRKVVEEALGRVEALQPGA